MKTIEQIIDKLKESKEFFGEIKPEMKGDDLAMAEGAEMYVGWLLEWITEEEKKENK